MRHLLGLRVLFFGGKGGVGKTTCASACALAASRAGRQVLLISTDPAHSTSDIFERRLSAEEREIAPRLWAMEIDPDVEARRYLAEVKARLGALFSPGVVREAARQMELVAMMPGVADAALFDRIGDIVRRRAGSFDLVVFDTAPTGHTLRLLQMPELMAAWIRALSEHRREALVAGAASAGGPGATAAASDPVLDALGRRAAGLAEVRARLSDHELTAFVLVLVPERLPIEESARAAHALEHGGFRIGAIVVNRVLPDDLVGAFYRARKDQERAYLDEIDRRFSAHPRVRVAQLESDVHGTAALARIAGWLIR